MGSGDDLPAYPTPQQAFSVGTPPNTRIRKSNTQQSYASNSSSASSHRRPPPPSNYRPQMGGAMGGQMNGQPIQPPIQQHVQQPMHQGQPPPGGRYQQPAYQQPPQQYQQQQQPPQQQQQYQQYQQQQQQQSPVPIHPHPVQQVQQMPIHNAPPPLPQHNYQQTSNQLLQSIQPHVVAQPVPQTKQQKLELELRELFSTCDANRTGRLSEVELSNALHNFDHTKFQPSTVKLMIRLFDKDKNGTIEFTEFTQLWKYISSYKKLFYQADQDNNKSISFSEYQDILGKIGYHLNTDLVLFLFQKFSTQMLSVQQRAHHDIPNLKFDMFIESLIYLRKLTDVFKKYDTQTSGVAVINFQDFILEVATLNN